MDLSLQQALYDPRSVFHLLPIAMSSACVAVGVVARSCKTMCLLGPALDDSDLEFRLIDDLSRLRL
ncbi:MAG: hypothetical protein BGO20_11555 [Bosea sp. 67-29]|nr:MAG: hypothetical protein BGO20_11555 [Bosea sp. 67-29]